MRHIIAIDPGKMTGICMFTLEPGQEPVLAWAAEIDENNYANPVRYVLGTFPDAEVVCERFVITTQTGKNSQAGWSLELIGVLKQCLRDVGRDPDKDIHWQKPSDAKNLFPNEGIQKLGYWHKGGAGHALDAIRHGLLYMANHGWMPSRLLD